MKFAPQSAEKEPVPETIPSATTPKRHREEDDIPVEPLGDTKRVHVDSQVTVVHQFFEPIPRWIAIHTPNLAWCIPAEIELGRSFSIHVQRLSGGAWSVVARGCPMPIKLQNSAQAP